MTSALRPFNRSSMVSSHWVFGVLGSSVVYRNRRDHESTGVKRGQTGLTLGGTVSASSKKHADVRTSEDQ